MSNTCVDPVTLEFIQLVLAKIAIKMSECQTIAGNQECLAKLAKLSLSIFHSLTLDMQLLFSCLCSKVSSCQVVKLSRCQVVKFDPWDMLTYFCFHVYAQKSLFIGENCNDFFWTSSSSSPPPLTLEFTELVPS